jgi:hypothetical protein
MHYFTANIVETIVLSQQKSPLKGKIVSLQATDTKNTVLGVV